MRNFITLVFSGPGSPTTTTLSELHESKRATTRVLMCGNIRTLGAKEPRTRVCASIAQIGLRVRAPAGYSM
jgi:hypothetical protein